MGKDRAISPNVIRRLPQYLRALELLKTQGVNYISSSALAKHMGFTASQVRQDFNCFGEFGTQGLGYAVKELRQEIAYILGMFRGYKAILIGCGSIGRALMCSFRFEDSGIRLTAAFDVEETLVGREFNGVKVHHVSALEEYLRRQPVSLAVLAVPPEEAIKTTEMLRQQGIEAVWNFTNVDVVKPYSRLLVENVHFSDSLLALSYRMSARRDEKQAREKTKA